MAKHQIAYYIIEYKYDDNTTGNLVDMLSRVLTYIHGLEKVQRKRNDFSNQDKFAYLSDSSNANNIFKVTLKSASHSYRAPFRVSLAEITTDKQILGSPALGYNGRMEEVHEDVNITIKAKRGGSIKDRVLSTILPSLNNNRICRIKIKGKDEYGNNRTLDSLNLLKKTYVEVEKDENTGEFDSESMFTQLISALPQLQ